MSAPNVEVACHCGRPWSEHDVHYPEGGLDVEIVYQAMGLVWGYKDRQDAADFARYYIAEYAKRNPR